jgi:uncharacterized protein
MERWQKKQIVEDLQKKMVFVVGPRQSGKTWLAKNIMAQFNNPAYLNYDSRTDRKVLEQQSWINESDLLIFDEIHKMPDWKNYIKGVFDTKEPYQSIMVTGSARLDLLKQAGDSLAGRVFTHHLFPLSPAELFKQNLDYKLEHFLERSGFPEPYLAKTNVDSARWRREYIENLLSIDIFDIGNIQDVRHLRLVFELLRERVGSPISFHSIARDISISHNTVKKYIQILEALYVVFRITPYAKNIARSLIKEPKIYFFDNCLVNGDDGAKFENFVASCFYKHVITKTDYFGEEWKLHYLRTKDGKEVDFALIKADQIEQAIEVKLSDKELAKSLVWFHERFNIPSVQIVKNLKTEYQKGTISVLKANEYLKKLFL